MTLLGLLAVAVTVTGTVTVGDLGHEVAPLPHTAIFALDAPKPKRSPRRPPLEIHCRADGAAPPVVVLQRGQRLVVTNDRAALVTVRIEAEDGLSLLVATLLSRGQRTPTVRLPLGRSRVNCQGPLAAVEASVLVLAHDNFTISDGGGRYVLEAPPDSALVAWHPRFGKIVRAASATTWSPRF